MFDILTKFVTDAENLVIAVIDVLAVVFVGWTWWRTRAFATTLGAVLFAGVIVFGVNNVDIVSNEIKEDVVDRGADPNPPDPRAAN